MRVTSALFLSVVSATSIPSNVHSRAEGIPLSEFGTFAAITPEEAKSGADLLDTDFSTLERRATQGLPLSSFGTVHSVTLEEAQAGVDLIGTNFTLLPISGNPLKPLVTGLLDEISSILPRDTGDCANPNIRFEWDDYSASDKQAYVDAIQCLHNKPASGQWSPSQNRWEDIVRIHQSYAPNIHSKSTTQQTHKFLLWHRYYVWAFEQILRDECGFNRAMPWWDEKKWAGKFAQSTLFTDQYFGIMSGPTNNAGTCVTTGKFAGWQLSLGPGYTVNNPHCLQRAVNEDITAQTGQSSYDTCMARTSYPDFHSCVEFSFHAQGHNGVGATMADAIASPGDPTFFMHHLYVDYVFRKWQINDISRRTTISGCADNVNCSPLTLDTMVYMGNLCGAKCPDLKVRDLLNTLQGHMCYRYNY
ncbi:Uu.00g020870.m01.CDS01 [Anthostomella pinea]|uniref:Uu.00g020870.m01.CDS01 n=1 Tax=Anthostomella pinea TaxID=933095 RepID=A0AAI8YQT1_9PEZI|nr:Uu.00g020870.m01.CDS01 [Anthostomella pinea]